MDKKFTFKKVAVVLLMAVAYLATFILGATSGIIHPAFQTIGEKPSLSMYAIKITCTRYTPKVREE